MTSGNLFRGICAFLLIGVVATVALPGAAITPGAYNQVLNSGTALLRRTVLNMTGAGVTCVDNSGATPPRTDCTVSGGGGGGGSTSSGPYASLPAAGNNGNLYFSTNSPYTLRDNGATWDAFYLGSTLVHLPNALSWAAVDPSGATPTASTATGALVISSTTQNTGNNYWAGAYTAVTPPYTADFGPFAISNVGTGGISIRDSATGNIIIERFNGPSNPQIVIDTWPAGGPGYGGAYFTSSTSSIIPQAQGWVFRITNDNVNRKYWLSADGGNNFSLMFSHASGTGITENQVGFAVDDNVQPSGVTLYISLFNAWIH